MPSAARLTRLLPPPEKLGDLVTAGHLVVGVADCMGIDRQRYAIVFIDIATNVRCVVPVVTKNAFEVTHALQQFLGPTTKIQRFYSDNAPELKKAARRMGWFHDTSTPAIVPPMPSRRGTSGQQRRGPERYCCNRACRMRTGPLRRKPSGMHPTLL